MATNRRSPTFRVVNQTNRQKLSFVQKINKISKDDFPANSAVVSKPLFLG